MQLAESYKIALSITGAKKDYSLTITDIQVISNFFNAIIGTRTTHELTLSFRSKQQSVDQHSFYSA